MDTIGAHPETFSGDFFFGDGVFAFEGFVRLMTNLSIVQSKCNGTVVTSSQEFPVGVCSHVAAGVYVTPLRILELAAQVVN